jgi:DNA replication and repair protein RecF
MAAILAAGRLIEEKLRIKPILILDDIAAELDAEGRELMGQALVKTGWQVFASAAGVPFGKTSGGVVWRVQAGKIEKEREP